MSSTDQGRSQQRRFNVLHTEWSSGWGGQEQRIILECRKMMALGHGSMIACQPGSGIHAKALENGIPVEEVVIRSSHDLRAIRDIYRIIKRHSISVVNTHSGKDTWVGSFAAKLAGVDLLVRTRHLAIPLSSNPLNFVHGMADGIITTGEAVRQAIVTNNRIPGERVISIPTGVSLQRFSPGAYPDRLKAELGLPADAKLVTIVAVLRKIKRHDLFLGAADLIRRQMPEVRFLVVGDGPIQATVKEQVAALGLEREVLMTGHRTDIPDIMAISDVVVLTSLMEGVPQVLTQAMAMERAVVAANVGGIPDLIIDGRTGLFAEAGQAASFAEKICLLLSDDPLRQRLGQEARRYIMEHFTDDRMIDATIAFYHKLLRMKGLEA